MQYENLGSSTLKFSKIILGTWQAGKSMWTDIDDAQTTEAIRRAVEIGMTSIDTASVYGDGYSEKIIAKALAGIDRQSYQLASKVFPGHLRFKQVIEECEKSLARLQTDYLDLYQIHWPSGSFNTEMVPIQETMDALNQLKKEGKILHIGVSNFSKEQIIEAMQYGEIASLQPPYSLLWRYYDQEINPFCRKNHISILAYSSLAQGLLTGKFEKNHVFKLGDNRAQNKLMQPEVFPKVEQVLAGLKPYAEKYKTSIGNIAINWLISQANSFAIIGARNAAQVEDNAKAADFQLTSSELKEIDDLSKLVTDNMEQSALMWNW